AQSELAPVKGIAGAEKVRDMNAVAGEYRSRRINVVIFIDAQAFQESPVAKPGQGFEPPALRRCQLQREVSFGPIERAGRANAYGSGEQARIGHQRGVLLVDGDVEKGPGQDMTAQRALPGVDSARAQKQVAAFQGIFARV